MRKKIIFLKGLPASGKTTFAKEMVTKHINQLKRVNKDDLRLMIDNGTWSKGNEKMIIKFRDTIIRQTLVDGLSVIVDDTNLDPKHENQLREIAKEFNADFEVKFFDTPLEECILRDQNRLNPVGEKVIIDMYNKYLKQEIKEKEFNSDLDNCIICDIDGTLARMGDRNIYDGSKVYLDSVVNQTKFMITNLKKNGYTIIITTGRMDGYKDVTVKRLNDNDIYFDKIYMRTQDDTRKDSIIKKEIYENNIKDKYNVFCVFDDRPQVVEMRRNEGLFVFDCNQSGKIF